MGICFRIPPTAGIALINFRPRLNNIYPGLPHIATYQLFVELCEGKGDIGVGGRWGEAQEIELAENGSIVVQRLGNLGGRRVAYGHITLC